jgi:hypothetical protein
VEHLEKNYREMRASLAKNNNYNQACAKLYQLLDLTYKEKNSL